MEEDQEKITDRFRKSLKRSFSLKSPNLKRIALAVSFFIGITAILSINFLPERLQEIKKGKPSPKTIKAPRTIEFEDAQKTEELRKRAVKRIEKVYQEDALAGYQSQRNIKEFYRQAQEIRTKGNSSLESKLKLLKEKIEVSVSDTSLKTILSASEKTSRKIQEATLILTSQIMKEQIVQDELEHKRTELKDLATDLPLAKAANLVVAEVGSAFLQPNYIYNAQATAELQEEAAAKIQPVIVRKLKGETVLREGELVTSDQIRLLEELGFLKKKINLKELLGIALLVLAITTIFGIYLFLYQTKIYNSPRLILLLGIILSTVVVLAKTITSISPYLIPIAAVGMLTAILLNVQVAIVMVLVSALLTGFFAGSSLQYLVVAILSGLIAIFGVSRMENRSALVRTGLWVSLSLMYLSFTASLLIDSGGREILINSGFGLISGLVSTIITTGSLPFLESAFAVTTNYKLLDLCNPNQPLLQKLMMKAPGTYNHSIVTANLADSASEKIGANPFLVRAAAYYHDIGKMRRPYFFVENQIGGANPHDRTNPNLSYLIITAHVKEGVEIARKYHLPEDIINIIKEHHGTSLVTYFYQRARATSFKEKVSEANFRYLSLKPQTKEAALVMLADAAEATARTVSKPSSNRLEQVVQKIIQSKLEDGQLEESTLTLTDIKEITQIFTKTLINLYHPRIEYPGHVVSLPKRRATTGGNPDK